MANEGYNSHSSLHRPALARAFRRDVCAYGGGGEGEEAAVAASALSMSFSKCAPF